LQHAEHGVALLPERLPLRLDVRLDHLGRHVRDVGDAGRSAADEIVALGDLDDVDRAVLVERRRLDDADEAALRGDDDAAAVEQANAVRQADQEQGDERERPDRLKEERDVQG
jgi:hypothetical protein